MKKLVFLLLLLPIIGISQDFDDTDCSFEYKLKLNKHSGLFSCPHLSPKMTTVLNQINACNINKDVESLIIVFELDSLYTEDGIKNIFLKTIGIPEWSIDNLIISEIEE